MIIEQPTVSIIVPVYNAEKYLETCIQSIIQQSHKNFELLLINDGSKDSSLSICEKYAATDYRIQVLNQENAGVSAARNKGLSKSKGKYLAFVDADDFVENQFLAELLHVALKTHSDFVYCGYNEVHVKSHKDKAFKSINNEGSGEAIIQELIEKRISLPLWTCLIQKSIVVNHSIRFTEGCRYGEDQEFIYKILLHCTHAAPVNKYLYNYRVNIESAMGKKTLNHLDFPEAMVRVQKYISVTKKGNSLENPFSNLIVSSFFLSIHLICNSGFSPSITLTEVRNRDLTHILQQKKMKLKFRQKIEIIIWRISPLLYLTSLSKFKKFKNSIKKLL
jgi:glycosyltransferase involved in cell wall biosynthesis